MCFRNLLNLIVMIPDHLRLCHGLNWVAQTPKVVNPIASYYSSRSETSFSLVKKTRHDFLPISIPLSMLIGSSFGFFSKLVSDWDCSGKVWKIRLAHGCCKWDFWSCSENWGNSFEGVNHQHCRWCFPCCSSTKLIIFFFPIVFPSNDF